MYRWKEKLITLQYPDVLTYFDIFRVTTGVHHVTSGVTDKPFYLQLNNFQITVTQLIFRAQLCFAGQVHSHITCEKHQRVNILFYD